MNVQHQIDRLIALRAAEWYESAKADAGGNNTDFVQWLAESPRHVEAFLSITGEAPVMRRVFESGAFDLEELMARARPEVLELPVRLGTVTPAPSRTRERGRSGMRIRVAAAAVVVLAIGGVAYYQWSSWQHFETPIGEQRTVQLTEGSVVNLNALSRLDVRFGEAQRDIKLPRGEATFKVASDPARPFRVHTPGAVVEAVGTRFNVYVRADGSTSVAVLEGKVKVTSERTGRVPTLPSSAGGTAEELLGAGDEVKVRKDGSIAREEHMDVAEAVAWQQRKLIFKRTSLEDMAAEFNRYNKTTRIRLEGIEPGAFRFSGAFNADDPQSLATLLMRESDLSVEHRGDEIVIRGR